MLNKLLFIFLKDANTIKKVFAQRKIEIEQAEPTKSSLRIRYFFYYLSWLLWRCIFMFVTCFLYVFARNRRSAQGDRLSAITMALQAGSESDEDSILTGTRHPLAVYDSST